MILLAAQMWCLSERGAVATRSQQGATTQSLLLAVLTEMSRLFKTKPNKVS